MHWENTVTAAFHLPKNEQKINTQWEYTVPTASHLPQNELKINALGKYCHSCIPFTTKWTENQCIGNILSQRHSIYQKMNWKSMHWKYTDPAAFYLPQNELRIKDWDYTATANFHYFWFTTKWAENCFLRRQLCREFSPPCLKSEMLFCETIITYLGRQRLKLPEKLAAW
jgi:hypothetical protein